MLLVFLLFLLTDYLPMRDPPPQEVCTRHTRSLPPTTAGNLIRNLCFCAGANPHGPTMRLRRDLASRTFSVLAACRASRPHGGGWERACFCGCGPPTGRATLVLSRSWGDRDFGRDRTTFTRFHCGTFNESGKPESRHSGAGLAEGAHGETAADAEAFIGEGADADESVSSRAKEIVRQVGNSKGLWCPPEWASWRVFPPYSGRRKEMELGL